MSLELGTNKGNDIKLNRDGDSNVRTVNSEITDPDDVQTVEVAIGSGEDFGPEVEDVFLILPITAAYKLGLLIDDQVPPDASILKGEKEIYSRLEGAKLAKLKLNKDGEIILNDGVDYAVGFAELKSQIDTLRTQLLAHTHLGVTPGGGSSGVSSTVFTVNVDNTKVEKVRL